MGEGGGVCWEETEGKNVRELPSVISEHQFHQIYIHYFLRISGRRCCSLSVQAGCCFHGNCFVL